MTPEPTLLPSLHRLWLVDRSRYEEGLGFCMMSRFLKYHSGPTGYGITRKAQSMPLATGSYTHEGLAEIARWVAAEHAAGRRPEIVPDTVIRPAVAAALAKYQQVIELRGMRSLDAGQRVEDVSAEQSCLIEGMILGWCMTLLPWMLANFKFLFVEQEEMYVAGCTCGLSDGVGEAADHEARGCHGIGIMNRCDVVTERWEGGAHAYHEFKTAGQANDWWIGQWETKIQFALGILGAERRLGTKISEMFVHALIKGRREGTYNWETKKKDGAPIQQSPYCYGWRSPGNPPMLQPKWESKYDYVDELGKNRRLTKDYKKAPIWTADQEIAVAAAGVGLSPAEYWFRQLDLSVVKDQYLLVGPLNRQDVILEELIEEVISHENNWKTILWTLTDKRNQLLEEGVPAEAIEAHSEYQALLRFLIPRSWACRRMGQRYECEFVPYCFKHEGWERIWDSPNFIPRRPHHAPELLQAVDRGLLPPDDGLAEDPPEGE